MKRYVLDSYAMISFFENEPGSELTEEILHQSVRGTAQLFMSVLNWGEVYYMTYRKVSKEYAEDCLDAMSEYPISIMSADNDLTLKAAKIKAVTSLSFADAFAATLALEHSATLITGDPEFKALSKEITILWLPEKKRTTKKK